MKIAIDITPLQSGDAFRGIGRVINAIVEVMLKDSEFLLNNEITLIHYSDSNPFPSHKNKKTIDRTADSTQLYDYLQSEKIDLYHCFKDLLPLKKPGHTKIIIHHYDIIPLLISREKHLKRSKRSIAEKYFPTDSITGKILNFIFFIVLSLGLNRLIESRNSRIFIEKLDKIISFSDLIICISHSAKYDLLRYYPNYLPDKIRVVHLGVDQSLFVKSSVSNSDKLPFNLSNQPYFYYIGGFDHRKNIPGLIRIFSKFILTDIQRKDYKLVIIGKLGRDKKTIEALLKKNNCANSVILTDYIDDDSANKIINKSMLFLFPSLYEGFGLPLVEAMIHGVPAIAYDNSSIPEVAGDACILVENDNEKEFTKAIEKLVCDPELQQKLRDASIINAKKFTWENTVNGIKQIYEQLTST